MEGELESILNGLEEEGYSTSSISKAVHSLDEYQVKSRIELFQLISNASFQDDPKTLHRALEALVANNEKLIPQTPEAGLAQHCPTLLQLSTQIKEISEQALKEKSIADLKFQLNEFKNSINNGNLPEAAWCVLNLENLAAKERELENETKLTSDADTLMLHPSKEYSLNRSSANESIGKATNAESSFINSPLCNGKLEDKNASTALAISRLATSCRLELDERLNVAWTNILVPMKHSSLDSSKPLTIAAARSRGWIRKVLDSDPLFCIPELGLDKSTDVGESREPHTNDGVTSSSSFPETLYVQATVPSILEAAKVLGSDSQLLQKLADVILRDLLDPILKQKAAKGAVRIVSDSDPILSKMLADLRVDNDKAKGTNETIGIVHKKGFSKDSGSTSHGGGGGGGDGGAGGEGRGSRRERDRFDLGFQV
uniref:Uncharacterized protein n=1 Tax=Polytomella parva TaxID=51329 RepID=A0A7S0V4D9_9CHLO|mmetsp:Transcript_3012/g.4895  ORF Transcript_3012/g.4895 Transcript_3012/m.4895 type:complete len:429 (+) Transcript_3012:59-1345(+)